MRNAASFSIGPTVTVDQNLDVFTDGVSHRPSSLLAHPQAAGRDVMTVLKR